MAELIEKEQVKTVYTFDEIRFHFHEINKKKFTFNGILVGYPRSYYERAGIKSYEFINYGDTYEETYWIKDVENNFIIRTRNIQSKDISFEKNGSYDNTFIMA